tara:strand:+ start:145 stop:372 length:228 start_codon:yes stop_codon:yes gene_type:complete
MTDKMPEYTIEKMIELAAYVVESADREFLEEVVYNYLLEGYESSEEYFQYDWDAMFGPPYEDDSTPDLKIFKDES